MTAKEKFWKIIKFASPFIVLILFMVIFGGIYYSVEKKCLNTFFCASVTNFIINVTDIQNHGLCLSQKELDKITGNYSVKDTTTYWESIHFIVTTVTTIGFGDIIPCTWQGQLVTILISLIGIPICVISLARLGDLFGILLHELWVNAYKGMIKPPYKPLRLKQIADRNYVPLYLAVIVTAFWTMVCTFYFYFTLKPEYEKQRTFTFFTSFYFTMTTLMTIGSGEVAPITYNLIFENLVFILIGLALVGMSLNIIKNRIESFVSRLIDKIDQDYSEQKENEKQAAEVKILAENVEKSNKIQEKECQVDLDDENCLKHWPWPAIVEENLTRSTTATSWTEPVTQLK